MQQNPTLVADLLPTLNTSLRLAGPALDGEGTGSGRWFWQGKRAFDVGLALVMLPVVGLAALILLALNPFVNEGPLIFRQRRMGRAGTPFTILKFRSMLPAKTVCRGPEDPVEVGRITPLGRFIRTTRIDELPQVFNILAGEMSFVGPRPDMLEHAHRFIETVPYYDRRHAVRPGITGFAQVLAGYAEGSAATIHKARLDVVYIRRACVRLELSILARTALVMVTGHGAR
ncbi:sugar transferase [Acuticoccus sp.]|uniref:sugar transferase n=1 Tax=Acuticoccus sp. TaxID=1904378 RepID=UPI003B522336